LGGKLIVEMRRGRVGIERKEVATMQWEFIVALVIAIPVVLFPAAYVWYLNIGGAYAAMKEARAKKQATMKVNG